ncbi:MAG: LysM peptidoglycan-binding domain-containing protein [Actinobacteria bacterium]|nr:LysM peptidoglycan-binding domain-containing protein [Actinomycetota bacterium]
MNPIQGQQYTAEPGDTLPSIAIKSGWLDNGVAIRDANQFVFTTSNQEEVQPGEVLFIPVDPELVELQNIQDAL